MTYLAPTLEIANALRAIPSSCECLKKLCGELRNCRLVRELNAKKTMMTFRYKEFCFSGGTGFRHHDPTQKTNITHNIFCHEAEGCHNHMTRFQTKNLISEKGKHEGFSTYRILIGSMQTSEHSTLVICRILTNSQKNYNRKQEKATFASDLERNVAFSP